LKLRFLNLFRASEFGFRNCSLKKHGQPDCRAARGTQPVNKLRYSFNAASSAADVAFTASSRFMSRSG
jgi:hypothetical protein